MERNQPPSAKKVSAVPQTPSRSVQPSVPRTPSGGQQHVQPQTPSTPASKKSDIALFVEKEIKTIHSMFFTHDKKECEWEDRIKGLQAVQKLVSNDEATQAPNFQQLFDQIIGEDLNHQLADPRSAIVKETCKTITEVVTRLGEAKTKNFVLRALPNLYSNLVKTKQIFRDSANMCISSIVHYIAFPVLCTRILEGYNDKHHLLREKCAEYLCKGVQRTSTVAVSDSELENILASLRIHLGDSQPIVREWSRKALASLREMHPTRISTFVASLDASVQKQLETALSSKQSAPKLFASAKAPPASIAAAKAAASSEPSDSIIIASAPSAPAVIGSSGLKQPAPTRTQSAAKFREFLKAKVAAGASPVKSPENPAAEEFFIDFGAKNSTCSIVTPSEPIQQLNLIQLDEASMVATAPAHIDQKSMPSLLDTSIVFSATPTKASEVSAVSTALNSDLLAAQEESLIDFSLIAPSPAKVSSVPVPTALTLSPLAAIHTAGASDSPLLHQSETPVASTKKFTAMTAEETIDDGSASNSRLSFGLSPIKLVDRLEDMATINHGRLSSMLSASTRSEDPTVVFSAGVDFNTADMIDLDDMHTTKVSFMPSSPLTMPSPGVGIMLDNAMAEDVAFNILPSAEPTMTISLAPSAIIFEDTTEIKAVDLAAAVAAQQNETLVKDIRDNVEEDVDAPSQLKAEAEPFELEGEPSFEMLPQPSTDDSPVSEAIDSTYDSPCDASIAIDTAHEISIGTHAVPEQVPHMTSDMVFETSVTITDQHVASDIATDNSPAVLDKAIPSEELSDDDPVTQSMAVNATATELSMLHLEDNLDSFEDQTQEKSEVSPREDTTIVAEVSFEEPVDGVDSSFSQVSAEIEPVVTFATVPDSDGAIHCFDALPHTNIPHEVACTEASIEAALAVSEIEPELRDIAAESPSAEAENLQHTSSDVHEETILIEESFCVSSEPTVPFDEATSSDVGGASAIDVVAEMLEEQDGSSTSEHAAAQLPAFAQNDVEIFFEEATDGVDCSFSQESTETGPTFEIVHVPEIPAQHIVLSDVQDADTVSVDTLSPQQDTADESDYLASVDERADLVSTTFVVAPEGPATDKMTAEQEFSENITFELMVEEKTSGIDDDARHTQTDDIVTEFSVCVESTDNVTHDQLRSRAASSQEIADVATPETVVVASGTVAAGEPVEDTSDSIASVETHCQADIEETASEEPAAEEIGSEKPTEVLNYEQTSTSFVDQGASESLEIISSAFDSPTACLETTALGSPIAETEKSEEKSDVIASDLENEFETAQTETFATSEAVEMEFDVSSSPPLSHRVQSSDEAVSYVTSCAPASPDGTEVEAPETVCCNNLSDNSDLKLPEIDLQLQEGTVHALPIVEQGSLDLVHAFSVEVVENPYTHPAETSVDGDTMIPDVVQEDIANALNELASDSAEQEFKSDSDHSLRAEVPEIIPGSTHAEIAATESEVAAEMHEPEITALEAQEPETTVGEAQYADIATEIQEVEVPAMETQEAETTVVATDIAYTETEVPEVTETQEVAVEISSHEAQVTESVSHGSLMFDITTTETQLPEITESELEVTATEISTTEEPVPEIASATEMAEIATAETEVSEVAVSEESQQAEPSEPVAAEQKAAEEAQTSESSALEESTPESQESDAAPTRRRKPTRAKATAAANRRGNRPTARDDKDVDRSEEVASEEPLQSLMKRTTSRRRVQEPEEPAIAPVAATESYEEATEEEPKQTRSRPRRQVAKPVDERAVDQDVRKPTTRGRGRIQNAAESEAETPQEEEEPARPRRGRPPRNAAAAAGNVVDVTPAMQVAAKAPAKRAGRGRVAVVEDDQPAPAPVVTTAIATMDAAPTKSTRARNRGVAPVAEDDSEPVAVEASAPKRTRGRRAASAAPEPEAIASVDIVPDVEPEVVTKRPRTRRAAADKEDAPTAPAPAPAPKGRRTAATKVEKSAQVDLDKENSVNAKLPPKPTTTEEQPIAAAKVPVSRIKNHGAVPFSPVAGRTRRDATKRH